MSWDKLINIMINKKYSLLLLILSALVITTTSILQGKKKVIKMVGSDIRNFSQSVCVFMHYVKIRNEKYAEMVCKFC